MHFINLKSNFSCLNKAKIHNMQNETIKDN